MNITDIQMCADFYRRAYLEMFYIVTTYSGKSFILIGEKQNFPHLMGISKAKYNSNGYRKPAKLYHDIINRYPISTKIIPNNIATTSKMYKKVLNFTESVDIFWKNKEPLAINYNEALSSSLLSSIDILLVDINSGYMTGWIENTSIPVNGDIKFKKYCISSWIDESAGSTSQKEKYMQSQDIDIIKSVLAFDKDSDLIKNKNYTYNRSQKKEILEAIQRNNSNLLIDNINLRHYRDIAISDKINCKINGVQY